VLEVVVVAGVVILATVLGFMLHRLAVRRARDDTRVQAEGIEVADLTQPLLTLVALLLAFVVVQTFASFQDASDNASAEATAVLVEGQAATLLEPSSATNVIGVLQCYARAVAGPGWEALAATRETSPISDEADRRVEQALFEIASGTADRPTLDRILDADETRIEARRRRLSEAQPSVPFAVTLLLVGSVTLVVGGSAALVSRRMRKAFSAPVLAATVAIFAGTLVVVVDLDRPFGGFAAIEPTEMRDVEQRLGVIAGGVAPPCDEDGAATPG